MPNTDGMNATVLYLDAMQALINKCHDYLADPKPKSEWTHGRYSGWVEAIALMANLTKKQVLDELRSGKL